MHKERCQIEVAQTSPKYLAPIYKLDQQITYPCYPKVKYFKEKIK